MLKAFLKQVLRKIFEPVMANGQWQKMYKNEMYNSYRKMERTRNIGRRRLQQVGHVLRMKDERAPKKALKGE
jgi:hypothetical protein